MRYAEPAAEPLKERVLAQGGHECPACHSVIARSPRAFAYHVKKCVKRDELLKSEEPKETENV